MNDYPIVEVENLKDGEHYWVHVPMIEPRVYYCDVFKAETTLRNFRFNRNVEDLPKGTKIYGPIPKVNNG